MFDSCSRCLCNRRLWADVSDRPSQMWHYTDHHPWLSMLEGVWIISKTSKLTTEVLLVVYRKTNNNVILLSLAQRVPTNYSIISLLSLVNYQVQMVQALIIITITNWHVRSLTVILQFKFNLRWHITTQALSGAGLWVCLIVSRLTFYLHHI